jgi:hypothetical protein
LAVGKVEIEALKCPLEATVCDKATVGGINISVPKVLVVVVVVV